MSVAPHIEKTVCHQCFAVLDVGDNFCRHCGEAMRSRGAAGLPLGDPVVSSRPVRQAASEEVSARPVWSESPYVVVVILVTLGPLGLPMLWRSRRLPVVWKLVLTTLVTVLTLLLFGKIWHSVQKSLAPLRELQKLRGL